jgi:hypothetical protein
MWTIVPKGQFKGARMPEATNVSVCPLCSGSVGVGDQTCPHCRATPQWQDYAKAIAFSRKELIGWRKRVLIDDAQW